MTYQTQQSVYSNVVNVVMTKVYNDHVRNASEICQEQVMAEV